MPDSAFLRGRLNRFLKENVSRKKLIILNSHNKIQIITEEMKRFLDRLASDAVILCFKARIPEELQNFGSTVKISEDYLSREDYIRIDDYVFNNVSKNWYRDLPAKFKDIFIHRDIELGRIAEYDLQLFLLPKVKAAVVIDRAIKTENAEAVLIIDSNRELGQFDRFLRRSYGFPSELVKMDDELSFVGQARGRLTSAISGVLDLFAGFLIRRENGLGIVDARLFEQLGIKDDGSFIITPFEKGLMVRLRRILKGRGYISFGIGPGLAKKTSDRKKRYTEFDPRSLLDRFTFGDISYWDLVEDKIKRLIWNDFYRIKRNIDLLFEARATYKIKSIILRNDLKELEKTIVLSAQKMGIPAIIIQHGIQAEHNGHETVYADKIAVWGPNASSWYERFGNDPRKISVVGAVNFDRTFNYLKKGKDPTFAQALNPKGNKYLITLITSCTEVVKHSSFETDDVTYNLIHDVVDAARSIGGIRLVVKLHPNQKLSNFKKLLAEKDKANAIIIDKIDVHTLIGASDLVIVTGSGSTVGLKAAIMGKPVVVINLSRRHDLIPFVRRGVALGAYKREDIESTIKEALHNEEAKGAMASSRQSFISDFAYRIDGKATDRILKLIKNL